MAPFVQREWGQQATDVMHRIKAAFDPHNLLNPGVILNQVRLPLLAAWKPNMRGRNVRRCTV